MQARTPLEKKQDELYAIADAFVRLRAFAAELRRVTKDKPFRIANEVAWDAVQALQRTLIIDLADWLRNLHDGWLRKHLSKDTLVRLRASKNLAVRLVADSHVSAPPDIDPYLRESLAHDVLDGRRAALRRLFGPAVAARGQTTGPDVERMCKRLDAWGERLRKARDSHAHPFGKVDRVSISLRRLGSYASKCERIMNDLRLLVQDQTAHIPTSTPRQTHPNPTSADLVDLIVIGTIDYSNAELAKMPGRWRHEQREAYYAKLHARRRRKRTDSFNEPSS